MVDRVSTRLIQNKEKILTQWENRARSEVVATLNTTSLVLRNTLPKILTTIAHALAELENRNLKNCNTILTKRNINKEHGISRAKTVNYSIDQVIYEFHILREVLFGVLETDMVIGKNERDVIISIIEQAVNDAATHFSDFLKEIRERFFAVLTHDLKTPVSAASLGAQLILHHSDKPEFCQESATKIIFSMNRLNRMITDLLDVAKIQAGQGIELNFENFKLDVLMNGVVTQCKLLYGDRFLIECPPLEVYWSFDGILRILENLTSNAVKYSYPKTPITISAKQIKNQIILTVHNEGDPIPADQQKLIFQSYRRAHSTHAQKGWGLGLPLVKGIVESHGGIVRIKSTKKHGTSFILELPRYYAQNSNTKIKLSENEQSHLDHAGLMNQTSSFIHLMHLS